MKKNFALKHLSTRLRTALLALPLLASVSCQEPAETSQADLRVFVALTEGRALDGREGLMLYQPDAHAAVLSTLEEKGRYWGRRAEATAELERILERHSGSTESEREALYAELQQFSQLHMNMTCSAMTPGLQDLRVDGDVAEAYRVGENPGGEFRERVEFVRIDGRWHLATPENW